jgi:hypothetical protein
VFHQSFAASLSSGGDWARLAVLMLISIFIAGGVRADDFIVYSPQVLATQSEIEIRGYRYGDARTDFKGGNAAEVSVAHAFTGWWKPEIYFARFETEPGRAGRLVGTEFENTFQLMQPGQWWADFGFLAAYEHQTVANLPAAIEFGPLAQKTSGRFVHRINVIWEKQVGSGSNHQYQLRYSYSGSYAISGAYRPGLEAFGRPDDHAYQAGPVVAGEWHVPGTTSGLQYRIGVVLGINAAAPRRTWLAQFEYEFL